MLTFRHHRSAPLLLVAAVGLAGACTGATKDPFSPPTCQQLPADAVRQTVDRLAAAPPEDQRTGPDGAESGVLPLRSDRIVAYICRWGSTDPGTHRFAVEVTAGQGEAATIAIRTDGMKGHTGPTLTAPVPGEGRAWNDKGVGVASWVCQLAAGRYATTPYVEVRVSFPKHTSDPASDAKALAEAIVPHLGCTSAPSSTTTQPSPTLSH